MLRAPQRVPGCVNGDTNFREVQIPICVLLNKKAEAEADIEAQAAQVRQHADFVHASRADRERVFGTNHLPERKAKGLLLLMWLAFQDKILVSDDGAAGDWEQC